MASQADSCTSSSEFHLGSGGIDNMEEKVGIWGSDNLYAELPQ